MCATPGVSLNPTYTLRDTAGVITRFNASKIGTMSTVRGLEYNAPGENLTGSCPYIQYTFYDTDNLTLGASYLMPGQVGPPCIIFASEVIEYSGATMLVPLPGELLGLGKFWRVLSPVPAEFSSSD